MRVESRRPHHIIRIDVAISVTVIICCFSGRVGYSFSFMRLLCAILLGLYILLVARLVSGRRRLILELVCAGALVESLSLRRILVKRIFITNVSIAIWGLVIRRS